MKIEYYGIFRDGGSVRLITNEATYYVDGRIGTMTKGEVRLDANTGEVVSNDIKREIMEALGKFDNNTPDNVAATIQRIRDAMTDDSSWGYTVDHVHTEQTVVGYTVITDNGDSQYMTVDEFTDFTRNRR